MRLLLLLAIYFFSINCRSQTKKVVIRIDTLDFIDKYEDFLDFKLFVTNQGFVNIGEEFDSADLQFNEFPQYYNTVVLQSDSSQLQIPLDRNGGYFEINNLYNSDIDTLQIDRYRLYSNCNFDTVRTWTTYYKDGTLEVDSSRSNFKTVIHQLDCVRPPPDTIKLRVNDKIYNTPVKFEAEERVVFSIGNGSQRTIFVMEKDRFHYNEPQTYGINTVNVKLKE